VSGFTMILSTEDDIDVVGQATNGQEAVRAIQELNPDVVLMDVQMPVLDGIEATRQVADRTKVIILTTFDRDDYLFDALAAVSCSRTPTPTTWWTPSGRSPTGMHCWRRR